MEGTSNQKKQNKLKHYVYERSHLHLSTLKHNLNMLHMLVYFSVLFRQLTEQQEIMYKMKEIMSFCSFYILHRQITRMHISYMSKNANQLLK